MEIVIKIPEEWFNRLQEAWGWALAENVREAIKSGIILPKGHGRIVDIDNAVKDLESLNESFCVFCAKGYGQRVDYIGEVLVEADKEDSNGDSN